MEVILTIVFVLWLYTLMDNRESNKKQQDKVNEALNDIMNKPSKFDKYLQELDTDDKYKREFHQKFKNNKQHQPKPKPEKEIYVEYTSKAQDFTMPDTYTGSKQWYADKEEYLKSQKWYDLKMKRQDKDGHKCYICANSNNLECHHITYKNLFKEPIEDLRTLCRNCHEYTHRIHGYKYYGYFPVE